MVRRRGVRPPEPDFIEKTITITTPSTYSSRSFMEPTDTYKKRVKKMRKELGKIRQAGATAWIVNEGNVDSIHTALASLIK